MSQLTNFKKWNKDFKLGFTAQEIKDLGSEPEGTTLTWSLDSLGKTLEKKIAILKTKLDFWYVNNDLFKDDRVRLLKGTPKKELKWIYIDTETNKGKAPKDCTDQNLSGVELLDLACQNPKLIKQMDGDKHPYWSLGDIQFNVPGDDPWRRVPFLRWIHGSRLVSFGASWDGLGIPHYAVPVSRECTQTSEPRPLAALEPLNLELREISVNGKVYRLVE